MEAQRQSVTSTNEIVSCQYKSSGISFACAKRTPAWFDIRVIYVRLSSCLLKNAPDCFTIVFPARSMSTSLDVNGGRISASEQTSRILRRDRVDRESAEATYVSTDNLRTNGDLPFELHHKSGILVSGTFERSEGPILDNHGCSFTTSKKLWFMECNCAISSVSSFLSNLTEFTEFNALNAPFLEVYVAGRSLGQPIVLNQIVQLLPRRKSIRCISLDAIPEDDEPGNGSNLGSKEKEDGLYSESDKCSGGHDLETFYSDEAFGEGEEGELSWFNAGVRVGMGIGLGMCLGIGIGVGLMIRTYQATTGPFRRRLL
eukprot:Gb_37217 [translate_table: standard]